LEYIYYSNSHIQTAKPVYSNRASVYSNRAIGIWTLALIDSV